MDFEVVKRLLAALEREHVRYAIFGAVAMSLHGLVTRLGDAFAFSDLETERVAFDGLTVSVVTPRGLYAMKRNTVRLKDRADAEALKARFGFADDGET